MKTWRDIVEKAALYKEIGHIEHYLSGDIHDLPWAYVSRCEPGGLHRMDMAVSCRFSAHHPSGLTFSWFVDIESKEMNGQSWCQLDLETLRKVAEWTHGQAHSEFLAYLHSCAENLHEKAAKFQQLATDQFVQVSELKRLVREAR